MSRKIWREKERGRKNKLWEDANKFLFGEGLVEHIRLINALLGHSLTVNMVRTEVLKRVGKGYCPNKEFWTELPKCKDWQSSLMIAVLLKAIDDFINFHPARRGTHGSYKYA